MSPPSDVQVIAGENQVTLHWKADGNEFIDRYVIVRQIGSVEDWSAGEGARFVVEQIPGDPASQFIDTDVLEDTVYTYQVNVRFKSGAELRSELFTVRTQPVIKQTALLQNYPNPFNPETWIPYELAEDVDVSVEIYTVGGQLVRRLALGSQKRGRYVSKQKAAYWDGRNEAGEMSASGTYFYVLRAGDFSAVRKMVVFR